jgi:hypothetical protein
MSVEIFITLLAIMPSTLAGPLYGILKDIITIEFRKKKITLELPNRIERESDIKIIEGIFVNEEKKLPREEFQTIVNDIFEESHNTIKNIRDERLRLAKITFNWAITITITGVLFIFCGVMLLYWSKITSGLVSTSVGAITEVISTILLKLNKDTNNRLDEIGKTLSNFGKAQFGMSLIDKMVDVSKKDEAIRELAKDLQN